MRFSRKKNYFRIFKSKDKYKISDIDDGTVNYQIITIGTLIIERSIHIFYTV